MHFVHLQHMSAVWRGFGELEEDETLLVRSEVRAEIVGGCFAHCVHSVVLFVGD